MLFFKPHSLIKNLLFIIIVVFLFICIYLTASWGQTQVSVIQPRQLMQLWADNKQPFDEKKWQVALRTMKSAIESNSNNAQHYFDIARLYDWRAYQQPIWTDDAIKYRTKAIRNYKKSLKYRPTWSSAWINLAMGKTLNLEFGDEAKTALSNTITYGVWEKDVFNKVIWLSLANWNGLPLNIQQQVKNLIKQEVNKGSVPNFIQYTAEHFKWNNELKEIINSKN